MGLFDLFKKKEQQPVGVSVTVEKARPIEVGVAQRTPGELPMADIGGYVSPSGGFVNFGRFRVSGVNSSTGRKNTRRYEVQTEDAARSAAAADGLAEPLTVEVEPQIEPTERQMEYALDLHAAIPAGACKDDVHAIISRIEDGDEAAPDPGLAQYAHAIGVHFSRYVGRRALLGYMVAQTQGADRAALYAYAVYRQEKGGDFSDPRRLPAFDALRACGEQMAQDPALMKSLEDRDTDDFVRPNRGTKIYKATADFLKQRGAI